MLKTTLKNYINKHNNLTTTPKYYNTHCGEVSNTPLASSIYDLFYMPYVCAYPFENKIKHMFSWVKFNP